MNRTDRAGGILYRLFFYLPVIWAALLIAQSLGGGLPDLFSNLTAALEHPFQIQWTDKSLLTILICTGVYIMSRSSLVIRRTSLDEVELGAVAGKSCPDRDPFFGSTS